MILLLIAGVALACANNETKTLTEESVVVEGPALQENKEVEKLTFELVLELEKLDQNNYNFLATMKLDEGAYYGSPHSNNSYLGLFDIEFEKNEKITVGDTLIETPFPPEVDDAFSTEKVRWVKEETKYEQLLKVNTNEDFEVKGIVSTVVEPVCNRYEIAFVISSKSGEMSINQEEPIVANITN